MPTLQNIVRYRGAVGELELSMINVIDEIRDGTRAALDISPDDDSLVSFCPDARGQDRRVGEHLLIVKNGAQYHSGLRISTKQFTLSIFFHITVAPWATPSPEVQKWVLMVGQLPVSLRVTKEGLNGNDKSVAGDAIAKAIKDAADKGVDSVHGEGSALNDMSAAAREHY